MTLTKEHLRAVMTGTRKNRVEGLREILGYLNIQKDPEGSPFWYLRPGANRAQAEETQPIAVGFYSELNSYSNSEIKVFLTSQERQQEIYGHYTMRTGENQPVMYILLPTEEETGRVALVLPTEGKLRQRQIQTFEWNSLQLLNSRLPRLHQNSLPIADKALLSTPLVEWVFYDSVATAKDLAQRLAEVTQRIEAVIPDVYAAESEDGYLHQLFVSFQRELLPNLKINSNNEKDYSFADIYAQTVAYGLFTARIFSYEKYKDNLISTEFNRQTAWKLLPETNPFLRDLFKHISNKLPQELGDDLIEAIAEIISYLRVAKMDVILRDFHQKMNREDIVIRFYEDFLAAYKPQMRERRGVYYTPEPVVSYMVRSVDEMLKNKFNKSLGLADPEVMILDPACGTGTFLLWICQLIHQRFQESPEALTQGLADKSWSSYVKERLLPRIFGFELLMAPYAITHLKLGLFLEETGYQFDSGKRLGVYLTNTLDEATNKTETLFAEFVANEANEASEIKRSLPIMAVIGNPPYSANSANTNEWAANLVRGSYYPRDEIKEQNPKLLLDDYVKFIRTAQWRIEQTGYGILSFITNHGYFDNPTFRGMRQSLMKTFDHIYALDLHGNVKKKEQTPNGSVDKNVFDIQQGVSIGMFAKLPDQSESVASVRHAHLWGTSEVKNDWLNINSINSTDWSHLNPTLPFSLFIPQNNYLLPEYEQGWKITDIMTVNSTGVKTHRDHFVIDFDAETLKSRIAEFRNLDVSDSDIAAKYSISDTRDWKIKPRRRSLAENEEWEKHLTQYLYRPFDTRAYYHHQDIVELPRTQVMQHLLAGENLGLILARQTREKWDTLVTNQIIDHKSLAAYDTNSLFPLYIYPTTEAQKAMGMEKCPNLSPSFLSKLKTLLGYTSTPEAIFYYIYSIFHSPTYRTRYAEFLKIDFPRIPLTSSDKLFRQLATYGEELVALHLMKSPKLENLITQFVEDRGDRLVDAGHPKFSQGQVVINKKGDKFTGVPEDVWNFHVGGYQVCQKWLKDRKGRTLSNEDILHYQKIVVSLKETIELMAKIDAVIPGFPIQ